MATRAEYSVLEFGSSPLGVLLHDPYTDRLGQKLRSDVETEDDDLLDLLPEDLDRKAREIGGEALLTLFEDSLSNTVRISERRPVAVGDFDAALERLFEEHVLGVTPMRCRGPVPLYSLRAAAGRFGEDMESEPEGTVPAPPGVRATADLFAVHIVGHSMEPDIPDGSVAVFRYAPAGSRQGKRVLVWRRGASGGGEFTLKVYASEKRRTEEGWEHARILLKPLNPEYPVLELDEDSEYRVLGELAGVLGIDEL